MDHWRLKKALGRTYSRIAATISKALIRNIMQYIGNIGLLNGEDIKFIKNTCFSIVMPEKWLERIAEAATMSGSELLVLKTVSSRVVYKLEAGFVDIQKENSTKKTNIYKNK